VCGVESPLAGLVEDLGGVLEGPLFKGFAGGGAVGARLRFVELTVEVAQQEDVSLGGIICPEGGELLK